MVQFSASCFFCLQEVGVYSRNREDPLTRKGICFAFIIPCEGINGE